MTELLIYGAEGGVVAITALVFAWGALRRSRCLYRCLSGSSTCEIPAQDQSRTTSRIGSCL